MKLNKRYQRNIKNNLSFYVSASLLTAISVFLLVVAYTAVFMIDQGFEKLMEEGNVENAQFTTLTPIEDTEIKKIEDTYNTQLERIRYVDIEEEAYSLRVFAPTEKINKYKVLEGVDISTDNEILLNRDFAKANDIIIGSSISFGQKDYIVVGFAVRPDYLYAQKNTTDYYLDKAIFGQVTMSSAAFDKLEHTQTYYAVVYHKNNNVALRQYLYENYFTLNYMAATANNRIDMVTDFAGEYGIMIGIIIPVMFAMICAIVAVVVSRKVKREQKQIGTLVAMGYRKNEMVRHYAVYAAIPGVVGSAIGIAFAVIFLKPVSLYLAVDYEQINYEIKIYLTSIIIAVFAPALLYIQIAVLTVLRLLRKNTVNLLAGNVGNNSKRKIRFLAKSKMSFRIKFQIRSILKHKSRTFVVIMGMFVGGFVSALGFIMIDSCNYLIEKGLDTAGNYEYQYYLNTIETAELEAGEPILSVRFEVKGYKSPFTLSGIVEEPKYLKLNTKSGKPIEYGKYYMTSNAAALYGVQAGEEFTFINILTTKEYKVTIEDIIVDNMQCSLYTSRTNLAKLLGVPKEGYNVVMSDTKLALDKDKIYLEKSKEDLKAQLQYSIKLIMSFIYLIVAFGAVLCLITVYLTVNMLIEENRGSISMLEVLGYRKREINKLVLNSNHILLPISFVLSIWLSIKLCEKLFEAFIKELNVYIEPTITITSMLICLLMLVISYFTSLTMLKRKVYRINMVESLKDNRE